MRPLPLYHVSHLDPEDGNPVLPEIWVSTQESVLPVHKTALGTRAEARCGGGVYTWPPFRPGQTPNLRSHPWTTTLLAPSWRVTEGRRDGGEGGLV